MIDQVILNDLIYLVAASLFIFGLKKLSSVKTARTGNFLAIAGMLLAVGATLLDRGIVYYGWITIGITIGAAVGVLFAKLVKMTAMPQMVALFNGFGGLASAAVACSEFVKVSSNSTPLTLIPIELGTFVGALTFTGSLIAFGKLQGIVIQQPFVFPLQKTLNLLITFICIGLGTWLVLDPTLSNLYWAILMAAFLLGILLVLPIGGADMPVVISLLNSYSGLAAAITGFVLMNKMLIIAGSLVGAAGLILTRIMCKAMNRSLANVAFGAFGKAEKGRAMIAAGAQDYTHVKSCTAEEAAMMLESARSLIVVPGYGLAVARAQHAVKKLTNLLESRGTTVKYAIHPVAGRMPGHMNVLLAEAEVPYEQLYEMDAINPEFDQTDVALVIGANDVTNPSARNEPGSPIYGMPILDVNKAKSIIVIKRSLSPGFSGIKNPLFEDEKTVLFFSDAQKAVEQLTKELQEM